MNALVKPGHAFVYTEEGAVIRCNIDHMVKAGDPVDMPFGNKNSVPATWIKRGFVKEIRITCTGCKHLLELRPKECTDCLEFSRWEER